MKARIFAISAILSVLCACTALPEPEQPKDPQNPVPGKYQGPWSIIQIDDQGRPVKQWEVTDYKYSMFERSVEFEDATGKTVRLTGSFEIARKP